MEPQIQVKRFLFLTERLKRDTLTTPTAGGYSKVCEKHFPARAPQLMSARDRKGWDLAGEAGGCGSGCSAGAVSSLRRQ